MSIKCQLVAIDNIIKPCYDKILKFCLFFNHENALFFAFGIIVSTAG
ncbi:Outer membrane protein [Moraxella catarrhalis]|nr:Outer membrane protein [Moraxella catarrhalis]